jgi:hypothetical protein
MQGNSVKELLAMQDNDFLGYKEYNREAVPLIVRLSGAGGDLQAALR